jgi:photosystem II stability/assembly factor-like uncharacterized protein
MRASIERFRTVLGAAAAVLAAAFVCAGCAKSAESPVAMPGRAAEVTVAPDNYGTLWVTTTARAYRSQDGGDSWRPVSGSAGGGSIAFSAKHAYLYGPRGARVGPFAGPFVRRAPSPPRPLVAVTSPYYLTHRLYGLDAHGGLWMSPNSGRTWSRLRAAGLPSQAVALAARRENYDQPDVIYVAEGAAGLWKSTDFGATFRRVAGLAWADGVATTFHDANRVLVSDPAGLLLSTTDGSSFRRVLRDPGITAVALDSRNDQNGFAATSGDQLLRSSDGGVSWTR